MLVLICIFMRVFFVNVVEWGIICGFLFLFIGGGVVFVRGEWIGLGWCGVLEDVGDVCVCGIGDF